MRVVSIVLCFIVLLFNLASFSSHAASSPPRVTADSAVLIEAESGRILYEKNAHTPRGMASTTKIMTALVALTLCEDLTQEITVAPAAVGIEGSSIYLQEGETVTLRDLLYALMLQSANDAAAAIAIGLCGSIARFAEEMNDEARRLGLTATHFANPHGLDDPSHQTTAYELAILSAHAMQNEDFRDIVSTKQVTISLRNGTASRHIVNHNRLLRTDDRVIGIKTGYTKACGRCLVTAAVQNDCEIIAVTLDAPNDWQDHLALYSYGFSLLRRYRLVEANELRYAVPITGGTCGTVTAVNRDALYRSLPIGEHTCTIRYEGYSFLYAPVVKGQFCGEAVISLGDEELARIPLYATFSVPASDSSGKDGWLTRLFRFLRSLFR